MKLQAVHMDDDENPATFTFEMTLAEAALLYRFAGDTQPALLSGYGQKWVDALDGLCSVAGAINCFYDGGVEDVAPKMTLVRRTEG